MNQEQRKYLKSRVYALRFDHYHDHEDDTIAIKRLRSEVEVRQKKISDFEHRCVDKKKEVENILYKGKQKALELIYSQDYEPALLAVQNIEIKFEEARARKYGSPAN